MQLLPYNPSHSSFLSRFWRRRRYQRLDGSSTRRSKVKITRIGGRSSSSRRFWRIKAVLKVALKIRSSPSVVKLLAKAKNAYIDMMVNLAGTVGSLSSGNEFGGKRVPKARQVSGNVVYSSEEVEARLVYQIYQALLISQEMSTRETNL